MKAAFYRWIVPLLVFCLPLIVLAGCDEDEYDANGITDIIYAIGDVVLAIIQSLTW